MKKILYLIALLLLTGSTSKGQSTAYITSDSVITLTIDGARRAVSTYYSEKYLQKVVHKQDTLINLLKDQNRISELQYRLCMQNTALLTKDLKTATSKKSLTSLENKVLGVIAIVSVTLLFVWKPH